MDPILTTEMLEPVDQVTPTNTPQPESSDMELTSSEEKIADTSPKGGLTISTIPKAQLETKPDFEFSTVWTLPVMSSLFPRRREWTGLWMSTSSVWVIHSQVDLGLLL